MREFFRIFLGLTSLALGSFADIRFPKIFQIIVNRVFGFLVNIDMDGAMEPIGAYPSLQALFTRPLASGARPAEGAICSPADGTLSVSCPIENGSAVQAKGINYSVNEFLNDKSSDWSWQSTIYLAPKNYHRVHSPASGKITRLTHFPGMLWPVNSPCVEHMPNLFCKNERLVFDLEMEGGGKIAVVMVAALNVGNMTTDFWPELVTSFKSKRSEITSIDVDRNVKAGDELGVFNLGSTVVLVFDHLAISKYSVVQTTTKRPILMGNSLTSS